MDIDELRRRADAGNVASQSILGILYLEGRDTEANYAEALRLLSAAAAKGASRAMLNLARMHHEGIGTPADPMEASRWYEQAARRGEFLAQVALARMYAKGSPMKADPVQAAKWYRAAAAQEGKVEDGAELSEAKAYIATQAKP